MSNEEKKLTYKEAVAMLPTKGRIHTFVQTGPVLLGADWERKHVLKCFKSYGAELAGETATKMNHGIVFHDGRRSVFVETI